MKSLLLRTLLMITSLSILAACATNPYTREQETSKTAKGAGKGAIIGAVIGAASTDDHGKGARNGALAGAALGAGAGLYMDKQNQILLETLDATGVKVKKQSDKITLILPGDISFDSASHDIQASFYPVLNSIALVLKEYHNTTVKVTGYTDDIGTQADNQNLSERRAKSVAAYLEAQSIDAARLQTQGFGERHPIASNETESGRAHNRRVQIELAQLPTQKRRFRRS